MVKKTAAQEWLTNKYNNEKGEVEIMNFVFMRIKSGEKDVELEGELLIDSYPKLREIDLAKAKGVTKLTIKDCPDIEKIVLFDNQVTEIVGLEGLTKLRELNCGKIGMEKVDISNNTKLERLSFHDNKQVIEIIGFENIVKELRFWNSIDGIAFPWEKISEKDLKEIAEKLGKKEEVKDKPLAQIKELVGGEIEKLQGVRDKVDEIPGLLDKTEGNKIDKVNEGRLEELKKLKPGEINKLVEGLKELGIENVEEALKEIKKLREESKSSGDRTELLEEYIEKVLGEREFKEFTAQIEQIQINKHHGS